MLLQKCHQIVRNLHRSYPQLVRKKPTPGVGHQLQAFENSAEIFEDPESFGDLESDFARAGKSHRQHEMELMLQRERVRQIMVKNKYFPEERLPNLLLYAEKEEIRTLHARNPEEWTLERLAESFPATEEIVKKIVKSKWRPYTEKRIREHDEAVLRNWERFRSNKENSDIPPDVHAHYTKFAARTLKQTASVEYTKALVAPKLPTPRINEFSKILRKSTKYAQESKQLEENHMVKCTPNEMPLPDPEDETYLLEKVHDKRHLRWQDLKKFKLIDDNSNSSPVATPNEEQIEISATPENPSGTGFIEKFETSEIVISNEDSKRYEMLAFKDRIHIPRKLWQKGKTYRVDDAYYDDDGEFLYRVPGMSGQMPSMARNQKK